MPSREVLHVVPFNRCLSCVSAVCSDFNVAESLFIRLLVSSQEEAEGKISRKHIAIRRQKFVSGAKSK